MRPIYFMLFLATLAQPAFAVVPLGTCAPTESLSIATQAVLGKDPAAVTTQDLKGLTTADLARLYLAAQPPAQSSLLNTSVSVLSLAPGTTHGTNIGTKSIRPNATTVGDVAIGIWTQPTGSTPFRLYQIPSRYDNCPTLEQYYNFNPNQNDLARGKDELRAINSTVLLGFYLMANDLDANGNPVTPIDQLSNFWAIDLATAQPWQDSLVPSGLGWPWLGSKPQGGTCPTTWKPAFAYDTTLYPFTNRCLALRQGNIHYFDETPTGTSKGTVLMVHGNPVWSFNYREIAQQLLADGYRVVAMDDYGFGLSAKPANFGYNAHEHSEVIEEFVEALDLQDFTLMVQDWGGPTGMGMGGHLPSRVKNLVVMNTWGWNYQGTTPWSILNSKLKVQDLTQALLPRSIGQSLGLLYGPSGSPAYLAVQNAYWGPFINLTTGQIISSNVAYPTYIFTQDTSLDRDFLEEVSHNFQTYLTPLKVSFLFSGTGTELQTLQDFLIVWPKNNVDGIFTDPNAHYFIQEYDPNQIVTATEHLNGG